MSKVILPSENIVELLPIFTFPTTSNSALGLVVPIPTLPEEETNRVSLLKFTSPKTLFPFLVPVSVVDIINYLLV